MKFRLVFCVAVLVLGSIIAMCWWRTSIMSWAVNRHSQLVPAPVAATSHPTLDSTDILTLPDQGWMAKPVIAADPVHRVIVAQTLTKTTSQLAQWRSVGNEDWLGPTIIPNTPIDATFVGDPWIEADRRGNYYFIHTSLPNGALIFRRSNNYAATWTPPRELATGIDRPVMGVCPNGNRLVIAGSQGKLVPIDPRRPPSLSGSPQTVSVSFTTVILESADFGYSWKSHAPPLAELHGIPFSVVVDNSGRIASSWIVSRTASGKQTTPQSDAVVCWSTDGGRSTTKLELVSDLQPDRAHPFNGERLPVLALSETTGVHAAYIDQRARRLVVRRFDWQRWSDPVRLSAESAEEVRLPAIDALGSMVHVTWLERRGALWHAYYMGSCDGGKTWCESLLLSVPQDASTLVGDAGFQITSDDDQTSIRDDGEGVAHAVWAVKGSQPTLLGELRHVQIRWPTTKPAIFHSRAPR